MTKKGSRGGHQRHHAPWVLVVAQSHIIAHHKQEPGVLPCWAVLAGRPEQAWAQPLPLASCGGARARTQPRGDRPWLHRPHQLAAAPSGPVHQLTLGHAQARCPAPWTRRSRCLCKSMCAPPKPLWFTSHQPPTPQHAQHARLQHDLRMHRATAAEPQSPHVQSLARAPFCAWRIRGLSNPHRLRLLALVGSAAIAMDEEQLLRVLVQHTGHTAFRSLQVSGRRAQCAHRPPCNMHPPDTAAASHPSHAGRPRPPHHPAHGRRE